MTLEHSLKCLLANSYALVIKAQFFHWNVEGEHFDQYHEFFAKLYTEVWTAVDQIAEQIRTLDCYAPGGFARFSQLATVPEHTRIPAAALMMQQLAADNQLILDNLQQAHALASEHLGIQNFLEDRMQQHQTWAWQLRSFGKRN